MNRDLRFGTILALSVLGLAAPAEAEDLPALVGAAGNRATAAAPDTGVDA